MNKGTKCVAICSALIAGAMFIAGPSHAEDQWQKNHPRRNEVNQRLRHENKRIDQGLKDHQLTKSQAQQLHADDSSIRQQERQDASTNGGHITSTEQQQLNQEENANSQAIYNERKAGQ
jgi:hypothetical protein